MNEHLAIRIRAIHQQLLAAHSGGNAMSNATRGSEREAFVDLLLRGCLPHPYRFGSGEVIDAHGNSSGQIDLIIERPFFPSFPLLGTAQHRLYLIDGVAVAIEIKSSRDQFRDAISTMREFHKLNLDADWPHEATESYSSRTLATSRTSFPERVGFAIVLYKGWARAETLRENCENNDVDVALQLDPPIFYAAKYRTNLGEEQPTPAARVIQGPESLLAFICVVNEELQLVGHVASNIYRRYVDQQPPPKAQ